jgi:hypothetical protein
LLLLLPLLLRQVKAKTTQLANIHTTIELLRHLGHRLKLVQKLRQQLEASPQLLDLAKAAKLLTDINAGGGSNSSCRQQQQRL